MNQQGTVSRLHDLQVLAHTTHELLRGHRERLPIFVEFSGCPKSGKSTCIEILNHFLKRNDFRVLTPTEGVSKRTPFNLREDWVSLNAWSLCYAIQEMLVGMHSNREIDFVFLDRGIFDALAWMKLLHDRGSISDQMRQVIADFVLIDHWRDRLNFVFLFKCEPQTSLHRETAAKLTLKEGSAMNPDLLSRLAESYDHIHREFASSFNNVHVIDTSNDDVSFRDVAEDVAREIFKSLPGLFDETIAVVPRHNFTFEGLIRRDEATSLSERISKEVQFERRTSIESSYDVKQLISYGIITHKTKTFRCQRGVEPASELSGKHCLLFGGHMAKEDFEGDGDLIKASQRCLEREIREEFIIRARRKYEFIGFVNDEASLKSQRHVAMLWRVELDAPDIEIKPSREVQEYARGTGGFSATDELPSLASNLDGWSAIVAREFLKLPLAERQQLFRFLFT